MTFLIRLEMKAMEMWLALMPPWPYLLQEWSMNSKFFIQGLPGLGSFSSLVEITEHCKDLELLSLANIGLPGNSSALSHLPQALSNCRNLKKLRSVLLCCCYRIFESSFLRGRLYSVLLPLGRRIIGNHQYHWFSIAEVILIELLAYQSKRSCLEDNHCGQVP